VYQEVLLGIPRKNGKSTIASAGGLYLLTSDGENEPEVYIAAAALKQATIVFRQQKRFVAASPGLQDFVIPRRDYIDCPGTAGSSGSSRATARCSTGSTRRPTSSTSSTPTSRPTCTPR
jgi:hypothetical protein